MFYIDIAFVSESFCKLLCVLSLTHHASRASLSLASSLKETEGASARGVSFWLIYLLCLKSVGLQPGNKAAMLGVKTIYFFSLRIYMKIEFSSQRREML